MRGLSVIFLCLVSMRLVCASTLDIRMGSEFIIEDGGASIRQFPFLQNFDTNVYVFFSEHADAATIHNIDGLSISRDGGTNWSFRTNAVDVYLSSLVRLVNGDLWGMNYVTEWVDDTNCRCFFQTSSDNGATWIQHVGNVFFPQQAKRHGSSNYGGFLFHRNMLVMEDGSLQGTMYGWYATDAKYRCVWVKSVDGGANWSFVSTIAHDDGIGGEGFCEPVVARCSDGSLLCVMRIGSNLPLYQNCSTNKGLSWSTPANLPGVSPGTTYSVDPDLCLMSNGVLVLSYGRPDCKLLFSADGCGRAWGHYNVVRSSTTSGYTGVREVAPGRLMVVGDEGADWQSPPAFRIWGKYVDVDLIAEPSGSLNLNALYEAGHLAIDTDMTWTNATYPNVGIRAAFDGSADYWYSAVKGSAVTPSYYSLALDTIYEMMMVGICLKPGYQESADIYLSTNGVDWGAPILSYTNAQQSAVNYTAFASNMPAQYVKVVVTGADGWPMLNEIKLFATDNDGDGIPDATDPDDDNDGMADVDELVAGTNPMDPQSVFKVRNADFPNSSFTLSFQSVSGKLYDLEYSTNLSVSNWNCLTNALSITGGVLEVEDPVQAGMRFYRLRVGE